MGGKRRGPKKQMPDKSTVWMVLVVLEEWFLRVFTCFYMFLRCFAVCSMCSIRLFPFADRFIELATLKATFVGSQAARWPLSPSETPRFVQKVN